MVDNLEAATAFSVELGLKLQRKGQVEGGWVDRVVGKMTSALPPGGKAGLTGRSP